MRIILLTGEFPPARGGIGDYTQSLARGLAAAGATVTVAVLHSSPDIAPAADAAYGLVRMPGSWGPAARRRLRGLETWRPGAWLHVQYQTGAFRMRPGINLAVRNWKRAGLRTAWTYHDLLPPYLLPKIGRRARDWVTFRPGRDADVAICTNPGDLRELRARGIEARETPVPSSLPLFAGDPAQARRVYGVPTQDLLLGHLGLALPGKGIQTLVAALRALRRRGEPAKLLLIGGDSGQGRQAAPGFPAALERLIAGSGVEEHVIRTGHLEDTAAAAAMASCDLMVMPFTEGASSRSSSLMACLAQGCVTVITTPQPGERLPAELPAARPLDHQRLADLIQEVRRSPERQATARRAGLELAAERTWDRVVADHLRIYEAAGQEAAAA